MAITVSVMKGTTNSHPTTSEEANGFATDFASQGIVGAIANTGGVSPATGGFAVNAQGTPDMTVAVTAGVGYVQGTPTSQNSQMFRIKSSASENVTISANSSGSTKYDWVYIKLDATLLDAPTLAGDTTATLVTSRSTSNTSDNGTPPTYGYCIAVVTVANGASSIANASIADARTNVILNGSSSGVTTGWIPVSSTWTYASATTITVPSGATSIYSVGDKVSIVQSGTTKYFYITAVASTLLTVNGGSDYTVANSAISGIKYSKSSTPQGFPQWFNYSPTISGITQGNGTITRAKFNMCEKLVNVKLLFTFGSTTSLSTDPVFTLPVTSVSYSGGFIALGVGTFYDSSGTSGIIANPCYASTTTVIFKCLYAGASYGSYSGVNSTIPFTWAVSDEVSGQFTYEAA